MSEPQQLYWESMFWGVRVGRATSTAGLDEWVAENRIDFVSLLVDANDPAEAQRAEEQGFRFMDVRVTLSRATRVYDAERHYARSEDIRTLAEIARSAHRITRFYADPRLPDESCDALYEDWIRRSFGGWADTVLVADRGGKPVGYVTVHLNPEDKSSSIGLIAVAESARGRGVGISLVYSALTWACLQGAEKMTVVTQGRNIAAQGLFQAAKFRTCDTGLWFHRHYREAP